MCSSYCTKEVPLIDGCAKFDETLNFDIELNNLPRMARLCLTLFAIFDKRIPKKGTVPKKVKQGKLVCLFTVVEYSRNSEIEDLLRYKVEFS